MNITSGDKVPGVQQNTLDGGIVPPTIELKTSVNQFPGRDYMVMFSFSELTTICPVTGQPNFATIEVSYIPDKRCLDGDSLRTYYNTYRQSQYSMECIVNKILDDLSAVCKPRYMKVEGHFNARNRVLTHIVVEKS